MSEADAKMAGRSDSETDGEGVSDPRQLVLPQVDTSMDVTGGRFLFKIPTMAALLATPAIVLFAAGLWALLLGNPSAGLIRFGVAVVLGLIALAGSFGSTWAHYPHERVIDGIRHIRRRVSLPWGYTAAVSHTDSLHGLDRSISVDVDGRTYNGVLGSDGRAVVPIRLRGSNTDLLRRNELSTLAGTLTQGVDSQITPDDGALSIYSTTRPSESRAAEEYCERADDASADLSPYAAGLLGRVGEWVAHRDAETAANEMQHYLVVTSRDQGDGLGAAIERRLRQAEGVIQSAEHLDGVALTTREAVNLTAAYWERDAFPEGAVGEAAATAAIPPVDADAVPVDETVSGSTPLQRTVAPEWYDEATRHVEIGDAVARTYWISQWPEQPSAKFLQRLYTMTGVDLDIKLYGHPKPQERVLSQLKRDIPRIDAEGMERVENMDVESITLDDDLSAYVLAYRLLQNIDTQPWGLSGYVTVRAPDAERLETACERVRKALKGPPARVSPAAPFGDQHAAFRSSAPFGRDRFAVRGKAHSRRSKTHTALGGVFGAALPAATGSTRFSEPGGIRWGRDVETGETIQVDPFDQGTAPHLITVGPSGSGKSFSVSQASQEWYMNGDDRTVIYCDTQGGFEDVVGAFDAEHIVIDGQTGINPLDIRPAPDHDRRATEDGTDQLRLKVTEVTEFVAGILRTHEVDPSPYYSTIEQGAERTYARAGITSDPATHSRESPTPADLFDTFQDMMRNPGDYTFTGIEEEADDVRDRVAGLLNELSGFKEGGKYENILNGEQRALSPDVDAAYLDMRQLAGQTDGAKSVNLQLAISEVSQIIKQTDGETLFVIDEAHNLLHSEEMVDWLNKAAREWRRYDAALWFVTQSPQEFVRNAGEVGSENKRETIVEQCSTVQIMNSPRVSAATLADLGLPTQHASVVQDDLVPGSSGKGYSECVLSFQGSRGWIRTRVEASPVHAESITFSHREADSYAQRMRRALDGIAADDADDDDGDRERTFATDADTETLPETETGTDAAVEGAETDRTGLRVGGKSHE